MTNQIDVRLVRCGDQHALSAYHLKNADFFKPWMPAKPLGSDSPEHWRVRIERMLRSQNRGDAAFLYAVDQQDQAVVAHCSLTQISYGAFRACYMGFGVDEQAQGTGLMTLVCRQAIALAFEQLELHRIMANHMPHNNRSAKLLQKLGFVREGFAKNYLHINGRWEDHVLMSLTNAETFY